MAKTDEIIKYVMNSPENTNPAILRELLSKHSEGGSDLNVFFYESPSGYIMLGGSYENVKAILSDTVSIDDLDVPKKIPTGYVISQDNDGFWQIGDPIVKWRIYDSDVVFSISGEGNYYIHPDGTIEE